MKRAWVPLGCALVQGLVVVTPGGSPDRAAWALSLGSLCGVAAGLALWFRDRAPLRTVAGVAAGYTMQALASGPVLPVALTVALYSATRRADRGPRTAAVAIASVGALVLPLALIGRADLAGLYVAALLAAVVGGLLVALRESRLAATREVAMVEERLRIARDLHDIVGHGMGAITVQAGAGRMALEAGAVDDATRALSRIEEAGRAVLRDVRWLVGILRDESGPPTLSEVPALSAAARRAGLDTRLHITGDVSLVSADVGEASYRIVQEALTNALRHSGCDAVVVTLEVGDEVVIDVADDGSATTQPAPAGPPGNGVAGMQERAASVGGALRAGRVESGDGWTVHAALPLRGRRA
ncbi:MAG: sensor histidine kinase [Actinomycetes bacterium]